MRFSLPAGPGRRAREIRQELYAQHVSLSSRRDATLEVTCVIAREVDAPPGIKAIEWHLLSNRPVETLVAFVDLVD
ncbi:hypothetical protein [Thiocystis violacea]|uniref:hypothetical protein n=1 Tax=Thiocystis violacea TaxID=13725 RepID=UPI003F87FA2F